MELKRNMKIAIIGSRNLHITNLEKYLPEDTTEIVSGGARGIDSDARKYALQNNLPLKEFLPNYNKYGRKAPLKRNLEIIAYADLVIAFWDGQSHGTKYVIDNCRKHGVPVKVVTITQ
ncbi:MAG: hypothetical protein LUD77_02805 [Clostridiales bacterium]|nr:hypothetical protein [Clostridiales bacterium]